MRTIPIVGADANNLRDVSVELPLHALTAIVGPSGSGKSSLVEDTLAAEAGARMRRFLDVQLPGVGAGDVRAFVGPLPPTLFAGQRAFRASSRTTLATCTGILRVIRRLFVRHGEPVVAALGEPVPAPSPAAFAEWLSAHASGRAIVWAVPVLGQRTTGVAAVRKLLDAGFEDVVVRSETDRGAQAERGKRVALAKWKPLRDDVRHTLEARAGEVRLGKTSAKALRALLERAWQASGGEVLVELPDETNPALKRAYGHGLDSRTHRVHRGTAEVFANANDHRLSFNAPEHEESGACRTCLGIGRATDLNEDALIVHPERSMHDGAFALWTPKNYKHVNIQHETIEGLRGRERFDPSVPWTKLSEAARRLVLNGTSELVEDIDRKTGKRASAPRPYLGFRHAILERVGRGTAASEALRPYTHEGPCSECEGTRWSPQARALRVGSWSVDQLLAMSLAELAGTTSPDAEGRQSWPPDARNLIANLHHVATALVSVGLGHLSADRGMLDISDGESRRARLAGVLTSRLAGLLLLLDEPARGLHEEDLAPLGDAILQASALHTVVISEHRQRLVSRADHVVELGPGPGTHGGRITYAGPVSGTSWASPRRLEAAAAAEDSAVSPTGWIELRGVNVHNVRDANVRLPLGQLVCIAGVSGSGKSSFVRGALIPSLAAALPADRVDADDFRMRAARWRELKGAHFVRSLHALDQTSPTAQRRSLVATYLGVAEPLRSAYASTPEARQLALVPGDFSTNSGRGRCQRCLGLGTVDDAPCPACGGLRFGGDVASIRVRGVSFPELLSLPIHDLPEAAVGASAWQLLRSADELGIGHLSLGRSFDTLSGGEIQRLRIARALAREGYDGALFVLDEPAGGLHPTDIERLRRALRHIVAGGRNTVILVEHDPYLLATCDHIVEFGPVGGPDGGRIVAEGPPSAVRKQDSPTGRALANRATRGRGVSHRRAAEPAPFARTAEDARRVRAEIRQIIGDDVEVATDDEDAATQPASIQREAARPRRLHEIADLDAAIVNVLLDSARPNEANAAQALADFWGDSRTLRLQVHPYLDALATWGAFGLPHGVAADLAKQATAMGLALSPAPTASLLKMRANGARFEPVDDSAEARLAAVKDALALGGGLAELVDAKGRVRGVAAARLVDLEAGLVGPRHLTAAHFRRLDPRGACPMCAGDGVVRALDHRLIFRPSSATVLDEAALQPQAQDVLKGVRRADMLPFFQRLAREGLWDAGKSWKQLDERERGTVLHGFWVRPGHGTFLKPGKDNDGSEVGHWLRWDGLVAALRAQAPRSKDAKWREAILGSIDTETCPTCRGSGLGLASRLLRLGERSWDEWVRTGTIGQLLATLEDDSTASSRARRGSDRIARCLRSAALSQAPLRAVASDDDTRRVVEAAADAFVGLPVVWT